MSKAQIRAQLENRKYYITCFQAAQFLFPIIRDDNAEISMTATEIY